MTDQHADFEADDDSKTYPKAASNDDLRRRIARAIHRYDNHHALSGNDIPSKHHYGEADFVLAAIQPELDRLRHLEDELIAATRHNEWQQRARATARELEDEAIRQRDHLAALLRDVLAEFDAIRPEDGTGEITHYQARVLPRQYEQWQTALTAAGPAATQATDAPTHNAGPSVTECAANDRAYWERKDAGDRP
jgi:hypothetical protein